LNNFSIHFRRVFIASFLCFLVHVTNPALLFGQNTAGENPYEVGASYTGDVFSNIAGGNDMGIRYLDNIDVDLKVDFGKLTSGLEGTSMYLYGMGNQGGSISGLVGDVQGVSNIEAENSWRIYEFWAQQKFLSARSSILVGLYDVNSEFNALNSSALFLNSSHGIDPTIALTGVTGPSIFPYTSLGARIKVNPSKGLIIQGAVLDGVPSDPGNTKGTKVLLRKSDGLFMIGEVGYHSSGTSLDMRNSTTRLKNILAPGIESDNNLALGGWYYTRERAELDNPNRTGNEYGIYALGEYQVFSDAQESPKSLRVFTRAGLANPDVNFLGQFFGAGLVLGGLLPNRPYDQTGLALAYAAASSPFIDSRFIAGQRPEKAETNVEVTHQFIINDHVQLQGNVQYVINPGFNATLDNAFVVGTRFVISL
jgi:porin|tara:strand:+ start:9408 stop:10676 length:1269 start_codon:yes stop_codon:yes gene_type:complete